MRQTLILLAITCAPAFCQDDSLNRQFNQNFLQRVPKSPKIALQKTRTVFKLQIVQTDTVCSIPLLNAKPAGDPVIMPIPRTMPQIVDHIAVKPPAPACPAR